MAITIHPKPSITSKGNSAEDEVLAIAHYLNKKVMCVNTGKVSQANF